MTEAYNIDCMEGMAKYPDKYFDLAIVDPPYGIGAGKMELGKGGGVAKSNSYEKKHWDKERPKDDYFNELFRVSKNQIVWGGNYFQLPVSKGWVIWKKMDIENDYSPIEMAWTSNLKMRFFNFLWCGMWQEDMKNKEKRIHPTQKPAALYKWLLETYAKPGDKILDTHLGSGSSRIAADKMGFDFVGFELDKDYFESSVKRYNLYKQQLTLFQPVEL